MSPTPPVTEENICSDGLQHHFNQTNTEAMNGHVDESAYLKPEVETVEKRGRGRPPKSAAKQQTCNGAVKKRGRPPKVKNEDVPSKQSKITDTMKKTKRTVNRFKGVTKEELMERFLPDRIKNDLDILIIGINPGLFAAYKGHHYAGPGNHFWKCLFMSGIIPIPLTGMEDCKALDYGVGLTNIVERTTPGSSDLSSKEIREGAKKLVEKIQFYNPKIAVFNGKGIYEIFSKEIFGQKKKDFVFGTQENKIPGSETYIYVMPSSSARCAQFPRAQDKVHFYIKLKQLRDEIKGVKSSIPVCEVSYSFDLQKATELAKIQNIKQERIDPAYEGYGASTKPDLSFPAFPTAQAAAVTSGDEQGTSRNTLDVNNNNNTFAKGDKSEQLNPETSGNTPLPNDSAQKTQTKIVPKKVDRDENNVTARHAHLVRYLRQDTDTQPGPSHGRKGSSGVVLPGTLSPGNPKLQEDVSEEQRQERVGNWVREQQNLEYDSDPPMGMERQEDAPTGQEAGGPPGIEIDGASQLSAISAGISGSASESTSGYGSVDASSRRVRLDRVEMWVMEQQHVRRHNTSNQHQIQQSIQAASSSAHNQLTPTSQIQPHFQLAGWQQMITQTPVGYTVPGPIIVQTLAGQMHTTSNRNTHKVTSAHTTHANAASDQVPGTSGLNQSLSAGRSSPYGFARATRRDGGSGSSFGTTVRPPVPLYSSWGGEESSGGSGISSPAVMFTSNPTTQPSPTQPFVTSNTANNNSPVSSIPLSQTFHSVLPVAWRPVQGSNSLLASNYNL